MEFRFLIAFLLLSIGLSAQVYQTNSAPYQFTRGTKNDTILVIPRGADTPTIGNTKFGAPTIGAIFYRSTDSTLWLRSATRWNKTSIVDSFYYTISQLTDTSAAIYRSDGIVDTLAITTGDVSISFDSTSLSNRINLKLNISDTAAMISPYIRYAYRTPGVDSIYFVQGSGAIIAVKDSSGGTISGGTYSLFSYTAKTSNYNATTSDYTIDCTSGTFTVSLPTASGITGKIFVVKNSGTGTITIDPNGSETIDGQTTYSIVQYEVLIVQSSGTNWIII